MNLLAQIFTPDLFAAAIRLATPIALAAMGAAICERSGVVNIALEGMMLVSAFFGTVAAIYTHSAWLGVLGGVIAARWGWQAAFVIMGATEKHIPAGFAPIPIGLCLTLIHLISIPVTNTSVNPARSTGQAMAAILASSRT